MFNTTITITLYLLFCVALPMFWNNFVCYCCLFIIYWMFAFMIAVFWILKMCEIDQSWKIMFTQIGLSHRVVVLSNIILDRSNERLFWLNTKYVFNSFFSIIFLLISCVTTSPFSYHTRNKKWSSQTLITY